MSPKRIIALSFALGLMVYEIILLGATAYQGNIAAAYASLQTEHAASTLILSGAEDDLKERLLQIKQDYVITHVESLAPTNSSVQIEFAPEENIAFIMASLNSEAILEPDYIVTATTAPLEPHYQEQWYLHNSGQSYHTSSSTTTQGSLGIDTNWQDVYEYSSLRGQGITIAIIDSGVNIQHPELSANIWTNPGEVNDSFDNDSNNLLNDLHGWNFIANSNDISDELGHGTQAAGIIAARENSNGLIGIASKAKIMPLKVLNSQGNGSTSNVIKAINYAVNKGAKVINMSFGGAGADTQALRSACNNAVANGVVLVAAAGNSNSDIDSKHFAPAMFESVIAVGSITSTGTKASFSNTGNALDLVAPGVHLLTTRSGTNNENTNQVLNDSSDRYIISSGTSFSSPIVAATVALITEKHPAYSPTQIRSLLEASARDLGTTGKDTSFGYGLIDMKAALNISAPVITNSAPQITAVSWSSNPVQQNQTTQLTIMATDEENDTLIVKADMSALGLSNQTLDPTNTTTFISSPLQPQQEGDFNIPYTVSDSTNTASGSIILSVSAVPITLTITAPSPELLFETNESSVELQGTVTGYAYTISINNTPISSYTAGQHSWSETVTLPQTTNVFNIHAYSANNTLVSSDSIIITKTTTASSTITASPTPTKSNSSKKTTRKRRSRSTRNETATVINQAATITTFHDVPESNFAFQQITDLAKRGAVHGVNNAFFPYKTISRGEFLKIAMTDSGLMNENCAQQPAAFTDTANSDFSTIVNCAVSQNILPNTTTAFLPFAPISREQAIVWLVAIRRILPLSATSTFPDVTDIVTIPYIETARQRLWINGNNGLFYPQNALSRAEAAKIIVNSRS